MPRLTLPADFDPDVAMVRKTTEEGVFHETRQAAGLAARLIDGGDDADLVLAGRILEGVLARQEVGEDDPHRGNFRWMREDPVVTDLNAGVFILSVLLPCLVRHRHRLPAALRRDLDRGLGLALEEVERLDVDERYTNIALLDCLSRSLGGAYLGDPALSARGADKLARWMDLTVAAGHPFEFNSPTYLGVDLRALSTLAELAPDEPTRWRARAMADRLAVSVMLHQHGPTGRWAGPHGRAYRASLDRDATEQERIAELLETGRLPTWAAHVRSPAGEVVETFDHGGDDGSRQRLTTFHAADFSLGSATTAPHEQANALSCHYRLGDGNGVLFTRYLTNDRWFGDVRHATDRTRHRHLPDEGRTIAVQDRERVLLVVSPRNRLYGCRHAGLHLCWTCEPSEVRIWVGGGYRSELPLAPGDDCGPIVVEVGAVRFGLRLAARTRLGTGGLQLRHRDGRLVFEVANYRGPEKDFWETVQPGFFFRGPPICALYLEVAAKEQHADAAAFAAELAAGTLECGHEEGRRDRPWRMAYRRDARDLSLTVDLVAWRLLEGRIDGQPLDWPALRAPNAVSGTSGHLRLGEAAYRGPPGAAWLFGDAARELWVLGYLGAKPAEIAFTVPAGGLIEASFQGPGTLVWRTDGIHTQNAVLGISASRKPRSQSPS